MFPISLKRKLLRAAQQVAPVDTRNLQLNAIKGMKWSSQTEFQIRYDSSTASYIAPLEEGWTSKNGTFHDKHKGFIEELTVPIVTSIFQAFFNEGKNTRVKDLKPDDDLKQIDRRIKVYKRSVELNRLMRGEDSGK